MQMLHIPRLILATIAALLVSVGAFAHADVASACPQISCYDDCTGQYINGQGDGCSRNYDFGMGCWRSTPYCGSPNDPLHCAGGINCFDQCDRQYKYFPQANTCSEVYDWDDNCYRNIGMCQ